jgi:hypothetical protein
MKLLRSNVALAYFLYASTLLALLLLAFARMHFLSFEFCSALGYCLIGAITIALEWDEEEHNDRKFADTASNRRKRAPVVAPERKLLNLLSRSCFVSRTVDLCIIVCVASHAIRIVYDWYTTGGLWWHTCLSAVAGMLPPAISLLALGITQSLKRKAQLQRAPETAVAKRFNPAGYLSKCWNSFACDRLAYSGAYAGCITFILCLSMGPFGVGTQIAGFLQSSAQAAKIGTTGSPTAPFAILVSIILALLLCKTFARLAVQMSAAFQVFANRIVVHEDSILDALFETAMVKSTALVVPERHVGAKNILSILQWLATCYSTLFVLVAFCPPPLGDTITGWLSASLAGANVQVSLTDNLIFRLFLASIVAGYGAVPVAIMSCAFLFARKPTHLIISSQGLLCPPSLLNVLGLSPVKAWSSLRKVTVRKPIGSKSEILVLHFSWLERIELELDRVNRAHGNELLATADEFGSNAFFQDRVVELRSRLAKEIKSSSLVDTEKFSSTIFSPHKSGDRLNASKYRVVRKLAGKSLSAVYLARNELQQHVIIKEFVLAGPVEKQEQLVENFDREFRILLNLKHPAIAQVIEMFQEDGSRFIVFEHVAGANLREIVERRGPKSEKVVRRQALQIARVMQFLHAQQPPVVHRDLTPDNLMEDLEGYLKLIDFGAAHQFVEGVTGTLIGKQCYIAPEQLRGKPTVRSDIYSFGGTLYFLLTGMDPAALQTSDLSGDCNVSPELSKLIERCTQFEESLRYQSFDEVITALQSRSTMTTHEQQLLEELA